MTKLNSKAFYGMPIWLGIVIIINVLFWIISNLIRTEHALEAREKVIGQHVELLNTQIVNEMTERIQKLYRNLTTERESMDKEINIMNENIILLLTKNRFFKYDLISNKKISKLSPDSSIVFITDITGFIGYHLTLKLISMDIRVVGMDNFDTLRDKDFIMKFERIKSLKAHKYNYNILDILYGNITDHEYLLYIFGQYNITHIVHLINYDESGHGHSSWSYFDINTKGLINLFECIINKYINYKDITIIYGSSGQSDIDIDYDLNKPLDSYSIQRITNELLIKMYYEKYKLRITELRFFETYGEYGRSHQFYFKFTNMLFLENKKIIKIPYSKHKMFDFVHISDIIDGIISALNHGYKYSIFNLAARDYTNIKDIIEEIEEEWVYFEGGTIIKLKYRNKAYRTPKKANISLTKQYLKYSPSINLRFGIKYFIKWYFKSWFEAAKYRYGKKKYLLLNCILNPQSVPELDNYWNHHRQNQEAQTLNIMDRYYDTFKDTINNEKDLKYLIDIVIFVNTISWKQQISNIKYKDIIFINISFDYKYRNFRAYNDVRFIWWYQYLNKFKKHYKFVLITDLFDVKFARNPFEFMENVIGKNKKYVITGREDTGSTTWNEWREYMYKAMKTCYGAAIWYGHDMTSSQFMYNPGSGIAGYSNTINMILKQIVLLEMPYVINKMCDVNMVQYAKTMHTMNKNGNIIVLNITNWNSPFKKYQDYKEGKYVIYHK